MATSSRSSARDSSRGRALPRQPRRILDLAAVWRDTWRRLQKGRSDVELQPIEVYDFQHDFDPTACAEAGAQRCAIALSAGDSLEAARRVAAAAAGQGARPLVLNFASKSLPGGAVASGVLAQEETIFRCTSLGLSLNPEKAPRCYPLPPGRCLVSRGIAVVKDSEYQWLPEPSAQIDVATSAAQQKPPLAEDGLHYGDPAEMRMRAAAVLQAAVRAGSRYLVLGAWGCGGFRNPALGLAEIFRDLLCEDGYGLCFDYVEFAIPSEKHAIHFDSVFKDVASPSLEDRVESSAPVGTSQTHSPD